MNRIVRIKLTDFIGTPIESLFIEATEKLSRFKTNNITLQLWYIDSEIPIKKIQDFIFKYSQNNKIKIIIKPYIKDTPENFIFYDMLSYKATSTKNKRLTYRYKTLNDIIEGIQELDKILEFITKDKPTKLQKRNDYED